MILFYGKGRVSDGVKALASSLHIPTDIRDDLDLDVDFSQYDAIIPTPGVSPGNRVYQSDRILAEMDFAARYLPKGFKTICVTGTDGKSTTAWMLYKLLSGEYGEGQVFLSGNFEVPFSETVRQIRENGLKRGYIIIEVSSFMAYNLSRPSGISALNLLPVGERIGTFHPDYSLFTNFETDHLNWHTDLQDYFDAKMRLFENTTKMSLINEQVFIKVKELGLSVPEDIQNLRMFGMHESLKDRTDGEHIVISGRKKYLLSETHFSGIHNAMNILSATLITNALGICSKRTREYLRNISGLSHRLELIAERDGISYIDDSKSTSAQSLIAALGAFDDKSLCLIAGGSDKGDTFEHLGTSIGQKVKHAELIGQTREILGKICEEQGVSYHLSDSMNEAVSLSQKMAISGDTILLSPGCASFGMFKNYLERANKFREAVGVSEEKGQ